MSALVVAGDVSGTCTLQAPSVAGSTVLTLPVIATDTLAGIAATQTLTNKTLTSPVLTTPALGTPASGVLTNCTGVAAGALPAGSVLQVKNSLLGTSATGTTTIPADNTIPQITEGTQFLSLAITPISATSKLLIQAILHISNSAVSNMSSALFQDSTANAISAATAYQPTATGVLPLIINYFMTSGTTSSTTFTVRAGSNSAGTVTVNGGTGAQLLGGVLYSSITITEIAA